MRLTTLSFTLLAALAAPAETRTYNAFHPGEIWRDTDGVHINAHGGGVLHHDGVYYWFGEHKVAGRIGNTAQVGVQCYSSTDLYNWKNEGVALSVVDEPGHDIERGCVIERPKVIHNATTGKFVMWFHLELKGQGYSAARTAVAVSLMAGSSIFFVSAISFHSSLVKPSSMKTSICGITLKAICLV